MESVKTKNGRVPHNKHKNELILPKSYIDQQPTTIRPIRSYSLSNVSDINNNFNLETDENNIYRFKTERRNKKVSFNKKIHIIKIDNYKNENRKLYYGKDIDEDKKENITTEKKCLSCIII